MRLQGWQWGFVGVVMGASLIVSIYVEARRLLCAALDDRYGKWARFWYEARQPGSGKPGGQKLQFVLAFLFCHGLRDLWRLVTLAAFDLFVVFALLSPFWRYVYFEDWNGALAALLSLTGAVAFLAWKLAHALPLCRLHDWSQQTGRCERCGETYLEPEPASTFSWHGFWRRRLDRLASSAEAK